MFSILVYLATSKLQILHPYNYSLSQHYLAYSLSSQSHFNQSFLAHLFYIPSPCTPQAYPLQPGSFLMIHQQTHCPLSTIYKLADWHQARLLLFSDQFGDIDILATSSHSIPTVLVHSYEWDKLKQALGQDLVIMQYKLQLNKQDQVQALFEFDYNKMRILNQVTQMAAFTPVFRLAKEGSMANCLNQVCAHPQGHYTGKEVVTEYLKLEQIYKQRKLYPFIQRVVKSCKEEQDLLGCVKFLNLSNKTKESHLDAISKRYQHFGIQILHCFKLGGLNFFGKSDSHSLQSLLCQSGNQAACLKSRQNGWVWVWFGLGVLGAIIMVVSVIGFRVQQKEQAENPRMVQEMVRKTLGFYRKI